jgi:hypothetical protein
MNIPSVTPTDLFDELLHDCHSVLPEVLSYDECVALRLLFSRDELFRSTVNMATLRYGEGIYRYFTYPLPSLIEELRQAFYRQLAPVANAWSQAAGLKTTYPTNLHEFLETCRGAGQAKPTPLLLWYQEGGANALHQDNYGKVAFPLQVMVMLSEPGCDFTGGPFILREELARGRDQRKIEVHPGIGDAVVFPNRWRPDPSLPPSDRPVVKHGVETVTSGDRMTLGLIFHDAS